MADTVALGSIIDIIEIIRKDMTICMVYWINAIKSPTCIPPALILSAPTQTISTVTAFMVSIIAGIMQVITRLTNRLVLVKSLLTPSKRFSSYFWVPKARITHKPDRISRETRFSLSTSFCISLNRGIVILKSTTTRLSTATTATPMTQNMELFFCKAMTHPPTATMGA